MTEWSWNETPLLRITSYVRSAPLRAIQEITIEAHDLSMRFGDFVAVDPISLRIGRGEIFGGSCHFIAQSPIADYDELDRCMRNGELSLAKKGDPATKSALTINDFLLLLLKRSVRACSIKVCYRIAATLE